MLYTAASALASECLHLYGAEPPSPYATIRHLPKLVPGHCLPRIAASPHPSQHLGVRPSPQSALVMELRSVLAYAALGTGLWADGRTPPAWAAVHACGFPPGFGANFF